MEGASRLLSLSGLGAILAAFGFWLRADAPKAVSQRAADPVAASRGSHLRRGDSIVSGQLEVAHGHQLLAEHFGIVPSDLLAATSKRDASRCKVTFCQQLTSASHAAERGATGLRVLIATVPDPYDSHLDWSYDAYIESIQRAFAATEFVPDRFWIPAREDSIELSLTGMGMATYALHDIEPSVMLFRSTKTSDLVLLYVVYELPTSGVHEWAFASAVRERKRLLASGLWRVAPGDADTLRVIGPSFSGSRASLGLALDIALQSDTCLKSVRVVSGAATGLPRRPFGYRVDFHTTILSDSSMEVGLDYALRKLKIPEDKVAVLTESATQYGLTASNFAIEQDSLPSVHAVEQVQRRSSKYIYASFPLNIASLRSSSSRSHGPTQPGSILAFDQDLRPELSLADRARTREIPPVMAAGITVPSIDLELRDLTLALERHGVRAVAIRATDVRDKLMLAVELRSRLRNVQIFVFESHVLLARPEFSTALRGAYVISTYPLALENQWWSSTAEKAAPSSKFVFSSDAAIGVFNATLTLLGAPDLRTEYSKYSDPRNARTPGPPLWLSLVGRDGLVPLGALNVRDAQIDLTPSAGVARDSGSRTDGSEQSRSDDHGGLLPSSLVVCAAFLWLAWTLMRLFSHNEFFIAKGSVVKEGLLRPKNTTDEPSKSLDHISALPHIRAIVFQLSLVGTYAAFALCIAMPRLLDARSGAHLPGWAQLPSPALTLLAAVLGFAVVGGMLWPSWHILHILWRAAVHREAKQLTATTSPQPASNVVDSTTPAKDTRSPMLEAATLLLVSVGVMAGLIALGRMVALTYWIAGSQSDTARALALRSSLEWSGVSPLVPLLLLIFSFGIWSIWQIEQVRSVETIRTPFEKALASGVLRSSRGADDAEEEHITRIEAADSRMTEAFTGFLPTKHLRMTCVVAVLVAHSLVTGYVLSPEAVVFGRFGLSGLGFDGLILVGPICLLLAIMCATLRLFRGWGAVNDIGVAIAEWPLNNAFGRLPRGVRGLSSVGLIGTTDVAEQSRGATQLTLAMLTRTRALGTPQFSRLADAFKPLKDPGEKFRQEAAAGRDASELAPFREAVAASTMESLLNSWRDVGTRSRDDGDLPQSERPLSRAEFAALRSAEEYLAFEAVVYIESMLANVRRIALFLLVSLIAAVLLISSYPIQPASQFKLALVASLLYAVAVLFLVMTGMSKNPLLSRLTGSVPGKVTWDTAFVLNVVLFAILPLLVLSSSEFPEVRTALTAWAEPALRSLGR